MCHPCPCLCPCHCPRPCPCSGFRDSDDDDSVRTEREYLPLSCICHCRASATVVHLPLSCIKHRQTDTDTESRQTTLTNLHPSTHVISCFASQDDDDDGIVDHSKQTIVSSRSNSSVFDANYRSKLKTSVFLKHEEAANANEATQQQQQQHYDDSSDFSAQLKLSVSDTFRKSIKLIYRNI